MTEFTLVNNHGVINVTSSQIDPIISSFGITNAAAFQIRLTELNMRGTNVQETYLNAIAQPAVSDITPLSSSTSLYSVAFPSNNGQLPPINYTAGAEPGIIFTSLADAVGDVLILDAFNNVIKTLAFTCPEETPAIPLIAYTIVD